LYAWDPQGTAPRRDAWDKNQSTHVGWVQSVSAKGEVVVVSGVYIIFLIE
jgi:hypothetical protein